MTLIQIKVLLLMKAFSHLSGFVSSSISIKVTFEFDESL